MLQWCHIKKTNKQNSTESTIARLSPWFELKLFLSFSLQHPLEIFILRQFLRHHFRMCFSQTQVTFCQISSSFVISSLLSEDVLIVQFKQWVLISCGPLQIEPGIFFLIWKQGNSFSFLFNTAGETQTMHGQLAGDCILNYLWVYLFF